MLMGQENPFEGVQFTKDKRSAFPQANVALISAHVPQISVLFPPISVHFPPISVHLRCLRFGSKKCKLAKAARKLSHVAPQQ